MELIHGGTAVFGGGLEYGGGRDADRRVLGDTAQQNSQRSGGGMRGDDGRGFKAGGVGTGLSGDRLQFAVDPGSADEHARLAFEGIGEVDNAGSGAGGVLPVFEGKLLIAGKESKVDAGEGAGIDALNEADLVADGFEAAQLGFVIHEQEIGVGKGRVGQRVAEFFAAQRSCADDGDF